MLLIDSVCIKYAHRVKGNYTGWEKEKELGTLRSPLKNGTNWTSNWQKTDSF